MSQDTKDEKAVDTKQILSFLYSLRKWGVGGLLFGLLFGFALLLLSRPNEYVTKLVVVASEYSELNPEQLVNNLSEVLATPKYERLLFDQLAPILAVKSQDKQSTAKFLFIKQQQEKPIFKVLSYIGNSEFILQITLPFKGLPSDLNPVILGGLNKVTERAHSDLKLSKRTLAKKLYQSALDIVENSYSQTSHQEVETARIKSIQQLSALEFKLLRKVQASSKASRLLKISGIRSTGSLNMDNPSELTFEIYATNLARMISLLRSEQLINQEQLNQLNHELLEIKLKNNSLDFGKYSTVALINENAKEAAKSSNRSRIKLLQFNEKMVSFEAREDPLISLEVAKYHKFYLKLVAFALCGLLLGSFFGAFFELKKQINN